MIKDIDATVVVFLKLSEVQELLDDNDFDGLFKLWNKFWLGDKKTTERGEAQIKELLKELGVTI